MVTDPEDDELLDDELELEDEDEDEVDHHHVEPDELDEELDDELELEEDEVVHHHWALAVDMLTPTKNITKIAKSATFRKFLSSIKFHLP